MVGKIGSIVWIKSFIIVYYEKKNKYIVMRGKQAKEMKRCVIKRRIYWQNKGKTLETGTHIGRTNLSVEYERGGVNTEELRQKRGRLRNYCTLKLKSGVRSSLVLHFIYLLINWRFLVYSFIWLQRLSIYSFAIIT